MGRKGNASDSQTVSYIAQRVTGVTRVARFAAMGV